MEKYKFKKGDGVLGVNTTKEQRAEILKYAHENGCEIFQTTWNKKEGYRSRLEDFVFNGLGFVGCLNSDVTNPMSYEEIMTKINPQWLIGKKCKGFNFDYPGKPSNNADEKYIGAVGKIMDIDTFEGIIQIAYGDYHHVNYPLSEVHKHLVLDEEESKPYIPEKYEKALFWDDDEEEVYKREFICYDEKASDYPYIARLGNVSTTYKNCKPLPKEEPKQEKFLWQIQDNDGDWFLHTYYLTEDEMNGYADGVHNSYRKVESVEQLFKIVE